MVRLITPEMVFIDEIHDYRAGKTGKRWKGLATLCKEAENVWGLTGINFDV